MNAASAQKETRLQRWLRIPKEQRPGVYVQVYETAEFFDLNYWLEIFFSAGIAAFGLIVNSPAVIIGAMLISPLMGPIMATGLALAIGDLYLTIKAVSKLLASVALAIGLSAFIVWLLPFHSITGEILARINPNLLDLGIALFSGLAGSVAVCRTAGVSGVTTLPGVAIAVALMPPLCTIGYGMGSGMNARIMGGAGLLFLTNLVAIVTSAFAVFLLVGMNTQEVRMKGADRREAERFAQRLSHGPLQRVIANGGQMHWRILILAVLLAFIAVPLRRAFVQVAGETIVRGAVENVVDHLLPAGDIVTQQVEVGRGKVTVRLITTKSVPEDKLQDAKSEIEIKSGRKVDISVSSIASRNELDALMQKLNAPPPAPPPKPKTLSQIHNELMQRISPVVTAAWPAEAPIQRFDVAFSPDGIVVDVDYASARALDSVSLGLLSKTLQDKLADPLLTLNAKRVPMPRKAAAKK
ncbi:MAG: DUF389 domain-containing protein [Acidobacteriota bacterium]|nr:DUF389 domain-containing protein [Acidobacteriota bacterium]